MAMMKTLHLACSAEWNRRMTLAQPPDHGPVKIKEEIKMHEPLYGFIL
jgi:hypothetical protein